MTDNAFEPVMFVAPFREVPQRGIAVFRGQLHRFESLWSTFGGDLGDVEPEEDDYALVPVPEAAVPWIAESMTLKARWQATSEHDRTSRGYPVLPEDQARYEVVMAELNEFAISSKEERMVHVMFRLVAPAEGSLPAVWEARWMPITDATFEDGRLRPFRPAM